MKKILGKASALITALMVAATLTCPALASAPDVIAKNGAKSRYLLLGGIAVAVCLAFYIFLTIKTKKKK